MGVRQALPGWVLRWESSPQGAEPSRLQELGTQGDRSYQCRKTGLRKKRDDPSPSLRLRRPGPRSSSVARCVALFLISFPHRHKGWTIRPLPALIINCIRITFLRIIIGQVLAFCLQYLVFP